MKTFFASAERTSKKKIALEIEIVKSSPVMTGLLSTVNGMLSVLDENRQVVAINDTFLKDLCVEDPGGALGLRPGEIVNCVYSKEHPGGCGTSKFCSSCGAAIAIVSSLNLREPAEKTCSLTVNRGGILVDMALLIRSQPIKIEGYNFLLLFLQDITTQQQRAALERTFFHDVNNMLIGLLGTSEILLLDNTQSDLVETIHQTSLRLIKEIEIQRCLSLNELSQYNTLKQTITTSQINDELTLFFKNHPSCMHKEIEFIPKGEDILLFTDLSLLTRVLCNMILNALESTDYEDGIKVWFEKRNQLLIYYVWNKKPIPENVSIRIFQRNFSTKKGDGRGIGTYSMKLLGEKILGGKVTFKSTETDGTTFMFSLPLT